MTPMIFEQDKEIIILDDDGKWEPAIVGGRVSIHDGQFVPDENGDIIEYLCKGEARHEYAEELEKRVNGHVPTKRNIEDLEKNEESAKGTKKHNVYKMPNHLYEWLAAIAWYVFLTAVLVLFVGSCYRGCVEKLKKEEARKLKEIRDKFVADSIAHVKDSIAHVMDSLEHDPHYQDSMELVREERNRKFDAYLKFGDLHTMVILCNKDSIYHTTTNCDSLTSIIEWEDDIVVGTEDVESYRLSTKYEADSLGFSECPSCEERDNIISDYENCELVRFDDVPEIAEESFEMIHKEDCKCYDY